MEIVDRFITKLEDDADNKYRIKALSFFTYKSNGKSLTMVTNALLRTSKSDKNTFTLLQILSPDEAELVTNSEEYKRTLFKDLTVFCDKENTIARTLVMVTNDYVSHVLSLVEQHESKLVLMEIDSDIMDIIVDEKLSISPKNETQKHSLLNIENQNIKNVIEFLIRNDNPTAVFVDRGLKVITNIFLFILDEKDISILRYAHLFSLNENYKIMIWDAIGIINRVPELQKLYTTFSKKADGRMTLWNIDLKITEQVIRQQDLIIAGIEGWDKFINSSLSWNKSLPSTLIIKDELN